MSLPFMLDVAIGLILIFLVLSLLVAEIQELITTVLQWRAKHLKESIEILLAGGIGTRHEAKVKDLVNKLYDDPLIKNINHEAKGLPGRIRKFVQRLPGINFKETFGGDRTTGPSYIVPGTFTASLIEQTGLAMLGRKLIEVRLEHFAQRIVGLYKLEETFRKNGEYERVVAPLPDDDPELRRLWNKGRIRLIAEKASFYNLDKQPDFYALVEEYADIVLDFKNEENNLETSLARMDESLNTYIERYSSKKLHAEKAPVEDNDKSSVDWQQFKRGIKSLRRSIFGDDGKRALASETLRPSLLEFAELLDKTSQTYQEVQKAFDDMLSEGSELERDVLNVALEKLLENGSKNNHKNHEILIAQLVADYPDEIAEAVGRKQVTDVGSVEKTGRHKGNVLSHWKQKFRSRSKFENKEIRSLETAVHSLSEDKRIKIISSMLDLSRQEGKLFTDLKKGSFSLENGYLGLIDLVLDRLSNGDRHTLIYDSITALEANGNWNREYTLRQRSLFHEYETYKQLQVVLAQLPPALRESLTILARRAQTRLGKANSNIEEFRQEVAVWFDQSMTRASGVYKRNAKGFSIILGICTAIVMNVDTLYIVSRLSDDENLRRIVTESAIELSQQENAAIDLNSLDEVRSKSRKVLKNLVLPIGWSSQNLDLQLQCSRNVADSKNTEIPASFKALRDKCLGSATSDSVALWTRNLKSGFRVFIGWIVSGVAISIGAPFWFDALNRIINIRQTGNKPESLERQKPLAPTTAIKKV